MWVVFRVHQVFQEWRELIGYQRVIQFLECLRKVCLVTIQAECLIQFRMQLRLQFNLQVKYLHLHHQELEDEQDEGIHLHRFWLGKVL